MGTGGDLAEEDLFGDASTEGHAHAVDELRGGEEVALRRKVLTDMDDMSECVRSD